MDDISYYYGTWWYKRLSDEDRQYAFEPIRDWNRVAFHDPVAYKAASAEKLNRYAELELAYTALRAQEERQRMTLLRPAGCYSTNPNHLLRAR